MKKIENTEIEIEDMFIGDDTDLDFNIDDFNYIGEDEVKKRYIKPKLKKLSCKVNYLKAEELAKKVNLYPNEEQHFIVQGDFIAGDFIEALLKVKNVTCNEMYISTLSLSQNNIDSLKLLINGNYIKDLTIMISNYFYSHEKNNLVKYMLKELDVNNNFDLLVCRNHTKIILLQISNIYIVISGSSNLRSSNCLEQLIIQENKELYDFYKQFFNDYKEMSIINKEVNK